MLSFITGRISWSPTEERPQLWITRWVSGKIEQEDDKVLTA